MPDLIEDVRIDAKHSFEDVIVPVEQFKQRWGTRVAVLGGVDVDLLSRGTEDDVRRRTEPDPRRPARRAAAMPAAQATPSPTTCPPRTTWP